MVLLVIALASLPLSVWLSVELHDALVALSFRAGWLTLNRVLRDLPALLPVTIGWLLLTALGSTLSLRVYRRRTLGLAAQ